jgi:hypothetical protein
MDMTTQKIRDGNVLGLHPTVQATNTKRANVMAGLALHGVHLNYPQQRASTRAAHVCDKRSGVRVDGLPFVFDANAG